MRRASQIAPVTTASDKAPDHIAGMFDSIAPRYDLLNHVLSAGIDRRWRAAAIRCLSLSRQHLLLDICTGTADMPLAARAAGVRRVIGVDFAGAMLTLGLRKVRAAGHSETITLVRGDAERLPVSDETADAATVAFGIRNVQRPEVACRELARALRPGGRLAILEFGIPRIPGVRVLYLWYFHRVLPLIGRWISGHSGAYAYLPASVGSFPAPAQFVKLLERAGFDEVKAVPLTFGIVYLYVATKR